jgi:hypothetical protein
MPLTRTRSRLPWPIIESRINRLHGAIGKLEIRISKLETNSKHEFQISKQPTPSVSSFRDLIFELVSEFDIRVSNLTAPVTCYSFERDSIDGAPRLGPPAVLCLQT